MSDVIHLEVITPVAKVLSLDVADVRAPGYLGEFGVLPGHVEYVAAMRPGALSFEEAGQTRRYLVGAGFAEVGADKMVLLTDLCEDGGGIDREAATEAMKSAEQAMLEHNPTDHQYLDAQAEQLLQIARIAAAEHEE